MLFLPLFRSLKRWLLFLTYIWIILKWPIIKLSSNSKTTLSHPKSVLKIVQYNVLKTKLCWWAQLSHIQFQEISKGKFQEIPFQNPKVKYHFENPTPKNSPPHIGMSLEPQVSNYFLASLNFFIRPSFRNCIIGHVHDGVILLLRPKFFLFSFSYLNLVIPARFKWQKPWFAQERNTLKDSGRSSKCCHRANGLFAFLTEMIIFAFIWSLLSSLSLSLLLLLIPLHSLVWTMQQYTLFYKNKPQAEILKRI